MKKIFTILAIAAFGIACKQETKDKVKVASEAVSTDVIESIDSAKLEAKEVIDSSKVKEKAKELVVKGAEKVEQGAKKIKESAKK
jgi:hypothetical protein